MSASRGYPPGAPYGAAAYPAATTNGLAIASFVCSLLGLGLVGVVLGHIALGRIARTGEGGRGLAIAGLVIGYLSIVLAIIAILAVVLVTGSILHSADVVTPSFTFTSPAQP